MTTPPDSRISKASWVLGEKEQAAAIITCVMSGKQWERDDAARKIQRHILAIEAERDAREAECEALSDRAHMAEHALTASEKRNEEAVRLLRAVGNGGVFCLMAESSDDADVWYDQRDQFLEGK